MSFAITAAMATLAMVSTGAQIKAQNDAIEDQQESIAATTRMNYALKQQQEQELKAQAGIEKSKVAIEKFQERGRIQAAQAESGVVGASPLREFSNTYLQESITQGSITATTEAKQRTLALENQSTYLQSLSQINQLESQATTGADAWLQVGMAGVQGGLQGYTMGSSMGAGMSSSNNPAGGVGASGYGPGGPGGFGGGM